MRFISTIILLLAMLCPAISPAQNSTSSDEINYLLLYIKNSGYIFIRGGTEYNSVAAYDHLTMKYGKAKGRVKTAEDFITLIASKSYMTGEPYLLKKPGGVTVPVGKELTGRLIEYRKGKK